MSKEKSGLPPETKPPAPSSPETSKPPEAAKKPAAAEAQAEKELTEHQAAVDEAQEKFDVANKFWKETHGALSFFSKHLSDTVRGRMGDAEEDMETKKQELAQAKAELIGQKVDIYLGDKTKLVDGYKQVIAKRLESKVGAGSLKEWGEKIYNGYKKLGEWNLAKFLGIENKIAEFQPENKLEKAAKVAANMATRFVSVRTALSFGLLGAAVATGGGLGFAGAMAGRRLFSGLGGFVGVNEAWKGIEQTKMSKETDQSKLDKMTDEQVIQKMREIEVYNLMNGKEDFLSAGYDQLKDEMQKRKEITEATAEEVGVDLRAKSQAERQVGAEVKAKVVDNNLNQANAEADKQIQAILKKMEKKTALRHGVAVGVGLFLGSGAFGELVSGVMRKLTGAHEVAKGAMGGAIAHEVGAPKPSVAVGAGWVEAKTQELQEQINQKMAELQAAAEEQAQAEQLAHVDELATIGKGEGITHALTRQFEDKAGDFGYEGNLDDEAGVHKWAQNMAAKLARNQGYIHADGSEVRVKMGEGIKYYLRVDDDGNMQVETSDNAHAREYHYKPEPKGPSQAEIAEQQKDFDTTKARLEADKSDFLKEREEFGINQEAVKARDYATGRTEDFETERQAFAEDTSKVDYEIPRGMKNYDVIGMVGGKEFSVPSDYAHTEEVEDYLKLWQKNFDAYNNSEFKNFYLTSQDADYIKAYNEVGQDFNKQLEAFQAHVEAGKPPDEFADITQKLTKKKLEALIDSKAEAIVASAEYKPSVYPDGVVNVKGEHYISRIYQNSANQRELVKVLYDEEGKLRGVVVADGHAHMRMPKGGWPKGVKALINVSKK